MENNYAYIIAVLLLAAFLIYQELKRANRARLTFRIFAVMLALTALLFLILPIKYQMERKTDLKSLHFLTPGFKSADLKNETYFSSDSSVLKEIGKQKVTYVPDLIYHLRAHPEISKLIVYGYGLPLATLKNTDVKVNIQPAAIPEGIISCSWPDILSSSENFNVQGVYNNTSHQSVTLFLQGLGTKLDSLTIAAQQHITFNLQCKPKQIGKAVYEIIAKRDHAVVEEEDLPFQVIERPKIKVLVLASFPDFEYKFLRNWLFENKHQAYFRTRVSKDKFSVEQVNLDVKEPDLINGATFKKYDLVIADDEELGNLGTTAESLAREVEGGLGLIVRLNEAEPLSAFSKRFRLSGTTDSISTSYQPIIVESSQRLKNIPVTQPLFIKPDGFQLPIIENQQGKILASLAMVGKGRLAATAISSTFNWVLNAANADYAAYWSALMNRTARKSVDDFHFKFSPTFPVPGEQLSLSFQANPEAEIPGFSYAGKLVPVQQHQWLSFYWQANFWPQTTGWNGFEVMPGNKQAVFVYKTTDWMPLKAYDLMKENESYIGNIETAAGNGDQQIESIEKQVPDWTFLILFLISMGYLWFETKILH